MNPFKNTSANQVRGKLLFKGLTISAFAKKHGYLPNTVIGIIHRYCGKQREPTGIKTAEILDKLYTIVQEVNNECKPN